MCDCKNVEIGSYSNVVNLVPFWKSKHKFICVDKCLATEIKELWKLGIITTGCCCGHNKEKGFIGVEWGAIPRMKKLGYEVAYNSSRPNDEDSFIPKTKL